MKTLVFDTCFNKSYIVLSEGNKLLCEKIIESDEKNYHSAYLIPVLRDILVENKMLIKDLDLIGINNGPGSFTGVRAGMTIARVLCQQFNIKLVCVNSLQILSFLNKEKTHTTVVLDARKNKVYYGEYKNGIELIKPCLKDKDELISCFNKQTTVISDSSISSFLTESGIKSINYEESQENLGLYLLEAVQKNFNSDDYNWAKAKPLYIQKPSISKPKEKINVL